MVQHLTIEGEDFPVAFTMRAINQFCIKHKMSVGESFAMLGTNADGTAGKPLDMSYGQLADILYFGLKEGHRLEGKKTGLTPEGVMDFFDKKPGLLTEVLEMYGNSLAAKWAPDESKNGKKLAGKSKGKAL